jgi:hypothetical protein
MKIFIDDMTVKQYLKMKADLVTNTEISAMCGYSKNTKHPLIAWKKNNGVTPEMINEYCHKIWDKRMNDNIELINKLAAKREKPFYMAKRLVVKPIYFRNWYFKQMDAGKIIRNKPGRRRIHLTLDEVAIAKANGIAESTAYQRVKYLKWDVQRAITEEIQDHMIL